MAKILEWLFPAENDYRLRDLLQTPVAARWNGQNNATEADTHSRNGQSVHIPVVNLSDATNQPRVRDLGAATICPKCHNASMVQDGKCKTCRSCGNKDGGCGE